MAIFIEGCNVDFDGDIITCIPIRNGSGKKCPTICLEKAKLYCEDIHSCAIRKKVD